MFGYGHQFHSTEIPVYERKKNNFWLNIRHYTSNMDDVTTPLHATTNRIKMETHCRKISSSLDLAKVLRFYRWETYPNKTLS
jgi:hypothetical protein